MGGWVGMRVCAGEAWVWLQGGGEAKEQAG